MTINATINGTSSFESKDIEVAFTVKFDGNYNMVGGHAFR